MTAAVTIKLSAGPLSRLQRTVLTSPISCKSITSHVRPDLDKKRSSIIDFLRREGNSLFDVDEDIGKV